MTTVDFETARARAHARMAGNGHHSEEAEPPADDHQTATSSDSEATGDDWPKLRPAALCGLAGDIVNAIAPHTEASPVALLGHLLACFGNVAGRTARYEVEGAWHAGNLFMCFVGASSRARKGTALARIGQLFQRAATTWYADRVVHGLGSGEVLVWAVRDPVESDRYDKDTKKTGRYVSDSGVTDKRLLVAESEFGRVLQVARREGSILSAVLRQAWDGGKLMALSKANATKATGAHVSMVAHITADELHRLLDSGEIASGFANRFMLLIVKRAQVLPFGGDSIDDAGLVLKLSAAIEYATEPRVMTWSDQAAQLWRKLYPHLTAEDSGLFADLTARAAPQVVRLALVYALMDRAKRIELQHLQAALALWRYSEASVRLIFGDRLGDPVADRILRALREAGRRGVTRTEINNLFKGSKHTGDLDAALELLRKRGKATSTTVQTGGRPSEVWFASS